MSLSTASRWILGSSTALLWFVGCGLGATAAPSGAQPSVPIVRHLEQPPNGEGVYIAGVVEHSVAVQKVRYCEDNAGAPCCQPGANWETCIDEPYQPSSPAQRDAHAKHHGCVQATYEARSDVPPELAKGVFAPGSRFSAWMRFSNGNGTPQPDPVGDGRGVALKLMGVEGAKLLGRVLPHEEKRTQDFLMINHPVFFVPDVETYGAFVRAFDSGSAMRTVGFFLRRPRLFFIVRALQSKKVYNPLDIDYHSMAPYLLGSPEGGIAVKYWIEPVDCSSGEHVVQTEGPREDPDYLRHAMSARLAPAASTADVCFDMSILVRTDPNDKDRSIEDATAEWDLEETPKTTVARITIPPQEFESTAKMDFCEGLSFTPWHSLPEHQPLGGLNRLRLEVYRAISALRHDLNRTPAFEPSGFGE